MADAASGHTVDGRLAEGDTVKSVHSLEQVGALVWLLDRGLAGTAERFSLALQGHLCLSSDEEGRALIWISTTHTSS